MSKASTLYLTESLHRKALNTDLSNAISSGCVQVVNLDKTVPDCAVLHTLESLINKVAALLLSEDKCELAEGVCDCKGNCKDGLNQNLAGDPKLLYSAIIMSQV